ncbi:MAG TPA: methyltransferase domain-containing protein [Myxococcales bacterium]|nr:methyltransferase domain-containing protein [Myxococcales bacterium]
MTDTWSPPRYERFRAERTQPFWDLAALVEPRSGMRIADLGCGTGELTAQLHEKLQARETVGIDSSTAMLAKAPQVPGVRFEQRDIAGFEAQPKFDLVFSNAALHWVPDHPGLLQRLTAALAPGGQIAVQMPMTDDQLTHVTAHELARSPEFRRLLDGYERRAPLMEPVRYAGWLHRLGYVRQHVRVTVYAHLLASRDEVVEWVRGALLTDYQKRLSPADWERFLARYRQMLIPQLEDERPYFYTNPRILIWGALP